MKSESLRDDKDELGDPALGARDGSVLGVGTYGGMCKGKDRAQFLV
jgi:hypothetical protein